MARTLAIDEASALLQRGGVLAYPTEAVWGLGCDPDNEAAVLRLLELKQRPVEKGLILVTAHLDPLRRWLDLPALPAERLARVLASWPGPHTWVMPAAADAPAWITGGRDSIAVRISDHPVVIALCEAFGGALVSTSANRGGEPPARSRSELDPVLDEAIDGIVAGDTGELAQPTPIRVARDGSLLRS
ncbi:L-threonylcarbamoyladenylate synthase type 1 TsaC [Pseudoxanthomonas daejeonensis]|uniref:Threonylcarbamoyl-AMP synthase n=1 Tax=Pseudoxanthomonas daejeonensis TaxID=266062 RepID=A0ABQ6ZB82_9GAMM|nr:Sua5/YciO/YrdC/YwlC family protein [Pseudoxanthomonas daejeonensis]KAF1697356.1 tRNA threonylcarbamoyladenosine biosynthesis protein RimN [Pseudoxanthomonas daejeonensis]